MPGYRTGLLLSTNTLISGGSQVQLSIIELTLFLYIALFFLSHPALTSVPCGDPYSGGAGGPQSTELGNG